MFSKWKLQLVVGELFLKILNSFIHNQCELILRYHDSKTIELYMSL